MSATWRYRPAPNQPPRPLTLPDFTGSVRCASGRIRTSYRCSATGELQGHAQEEAPGTRAYEPPAKVEVRAEHSPSSTFDTRLACSSNTTASPPLMARTLRTDPSVIKLGLGTCHCFSRAAVSFKFTYPFPYNLEVPRLVRHVGIYPSSIKSGAHSSLQLSTNLHPVFSNRIQ